MRTAFFLLYLILKLNSKNQSPDSSVLKKRLSVVFLLLMSFSLLNAQKIPSSYSNIGFDRERGLFYFQDTDKKIYEQVRKSRFTVDQLIGGITGTEKGVAFDFSDSLLNGTLYYGLIPVGDGKYSIPVWFNRSVKIVGGKSEVNIKENLSKTYDMTGWQTKGYGLLGYRITSAEGAIIYDGKIEFVVGDPFLVSNTIVDGPFVDNVTESSAVISFITNFECEPSVTVGERIYELEPSKKHELQVTELLPGTEYDYTVRAGNTIQELKFKTAPQKGNNSKFTFAYASDSRSAMGGGERSVYGANVYIMRKIMSLAAFKGVDFMQFTGDLINGYAYDPEDNRLQYRNWKNAVQPFAAFFPIYETMGNHEGLHTRFYDENNTSRYIRIDRFPYDSLSAEALFADEFVNPVSDLETEDGSKYDPDPNSIDFPSYRETSFSYVYGNTAMIVLNSNYWFGPDVRKEPLLSGNPHAYIMDNQFDWFKKEILRFETDLDVKHIFVSVHTPMFPNGGHSGDDMWYSGNNKIRPRIAGKDSDFGIIERRDQMLEVMVNQSKKVRAVLTGDEHNYNHLVINPEMEMYPEKWDKKRLKLNRTIYQINNGAAGAPYYAQEVLPWSRFCNSFTTRNALVFITVDGEKISVQTINPDTLEEIETFEIEP